jgi:RNA polymerase sigma-70 factor (ECF subfamily)
MGKELRSKLESMDLAQEVLIRALRGMGDFTYANEGDFVRWLSKIAENAFRDHLDRLHADKRDIRRERSLDNPGANRGTSFQRVSHAISDTTPSMIASRREDLTRLEKAMDRLRAEYREVILLAKIEGLSYKQIGERLGKSVGAVKMLVSRATVSLASAFASV